MAQFSKIEWTEHTFNPWWGCTKVSSACDNCYAEAWAKRTGHEVWGRKTPRRFLSDFYWKQPLLWDRAAQKKGVRDRVFCASMADVFEWRGDLSPWRRRLWSLIEQTPNLDWLLLTKRPHLVQRLVPWDSEWPDNVWLGATVESQEFTKKRVSHLAKLSAKTKFLSCEPLRTNLELTPWLQSAGIDWVIAGGESGPGARPSEPDWYRNIRDQCVENDVAFLFKQWGDWAPLDSVESERIPSSVENSEWSTKLGRYGKKESGRILDGRFWDEVPAPVSYRNTQSCAVIS